MSQNTRNLLTALGRDPEVLARFKEEPKAVMAEHSVPDEHQKLILSGDKDGLREAAGLSDSELRWLII